MRRATICLFTALMALLLLAAPALAFPDTIGHPYEGAIEELAAEGIISGFKDGKFGPNEFVVRQQFAKMIVLTVGLGPLPGDRCPFSDVERDWPYPRGYVAAAYQNGITKGKTATSFETYGLITRAQVVTMTVRALEECAGVRMHEPDEEEYSRWGILAGFDDPDHGRTAHLAEYNGLLDHLVLEEGKWDLWAEATRGEVAQVLSNALWLMLLGG